MFEIPSGQKRLMDEYRELIIRKLELDGFNVSSDLELEKSIKENIEVFSPEDLIFEMEENHTLPLNFEAENSDLIREFVEERIGEEFLILEGIEDLVICLHSADDFIGTGFFNCEVKNKHL